MNPGIDHYRSMLKAMLPELKDKYGINELGLFGSRVRGDNQPHSDLDMLVGFNPDAFVSLFTLIEIEDMLSEKLGVKVDLSHKVALKPLLRPYILAEVQSV